MCTTGSPRRSPSSHGTSALLREQGAEPQLVDRILRGVGRGAGGVQAGGGALAARADEPLDDALAEAARDAARRYGAAVDMELADGIVLRRGRGKP